MIKEELRFVESTVMEGMTSISALLAAKKAGLNDRPLLEIRFDREKADKKKRELAFLRGRCEELKIPLVLTDKEEIEAHCIGQSHGGVIALCGERTIPSPTVENLPKNAFLCLLDGIEDPYNFGYALRSLYAAGCEGVILGERHWMSAAGVVARSSAGASEAMPIFSGDVKSAVLAAKALGYKVACAGIRDSISHHEASLKPPLLLVVGGEKRGISAHVLALADEVVRIDYGREFRGSLSAASAATVLAFEVLRQKNLG